MLVLLPQLRLISTFATAQRIDRLSNITLDGVTGLTDADIPDNITCLQLYAAHGGAAISGSFQQISVLTQVCDCITDPRSLAKVVVRLGWQLRVYGRRLALRGYRCL